MVGGWCLYYDAAISRAMGGLVFAALICGVTAKALIKAKRR